MVAFLCPSRPSVTLSSMFLFALYVQASESACFGGNECGLALQIQSKVSPCPRGASVFPLQELSSTRVLLCICSARKAGRQPQGQTRPDDAQELSVCQGSR